MVMNKEQYQQDKLAQTVRQQKIKQLKMLENTVNLKLLTLDREDENYEETYIDMLKDLEEIQHNIFSTRRNKNNSKFYEWKPSIGLNRREQYEDKIINEMIEDAKEIRIFCKSIK